MPRILLCLLFSINVLHAQPPFRFELNKTVHSSKEQLQQLKISTESKTAGRHWAIIFTNTSADTLALRNVVPEGEVFITGLGEHPLSRAHLFLPQRIPVNVVLPDNAWELGYASADTNGKGQCILMRRDRSSILKGARRRFETILYPGGSVSYDCYQDSYEGGWQNGLRVMFQQYKLFDAASFDSSMYARKDLEWIRKAYVMHLIMAWDKFYYDSGRISLDRFNKRGKELYG
ncbi:MAG TPA: hypothetical protein VFX73_09025, partial [Chitinophagaceae bacterium]|nr:hypothetical protein [Chitinophagaceae bacterium]